VRGGATAHDERHIGLRIGGQRDEQARAVGAGVERALHERIGHDADDRGPRDFRIAAHAVADGIAVGKIFPGERGVDEDDGGLVRRVGRFELPALQRAQAERAK